MIRYLIFLGIILHIFSCASLDVSNQDTRNKVEKRLSRIVDSLTESYSFVISFYQGCSGCIEGFYEVGYTFWNDGKVDWVSKVDIYKEYSVIKTTSNSITDFVFDNEKAFISVDKHADSINVSHYQYQSVRIELDNMSFKYIVVGDKAEIKLLNELLILIKSKLFELEKNPYTWTL